MGTTSYISVILPLKLEWEPCYSLPEGIGTEDVRTGDRVKVRFANRQYSGVVSRTGVIPDTDISKIRPITGIEEGLERILPEEIILWQKVAEYYMCSVGEVYKAAYPAGKISLEASRAAALHKVIQRREKLIQSMRDRIRRLEDRLLKKEDLEARSKQGSKAKVRYAGEADRIRQELAVALEALKDMEEKPELPVKKHNQVMDGPDILLTDAQNRAYEAICAAFKERKPVLLKGVTGSGKTEIYVKLALETMKKGHSVLYLVPEIALSRQLEDRLFRYFGESLMVFHSAETAAGRRSTAEKLRSSKGGSIVLGTRSSLFLPHHDLGLIVVDEEHDSSYKQESPAPRYNGRDTALMLSVIHRCNIVMGSATPSLEELYNCMVGRHELVTLAKKFHKAGSAEIEIIDTKAERRKRGMVGSFSRKLIDHISTTLADKGQVMILRSRRAWAPMMQCETCGEIVKCPHCNVSLSMHKGNGGRMVCHYCGYSTEYSGKCQKCGGDLAGLGAGTQKIEEEAVRLFPQARIARLDSDTARNKALETKTIREFGRGETDILIGTQILTKGFDFSNVRLVAIIAADTLLGMQDFRADEKAMQVLEQFRGRCGRRESNGMFIIQTSQPEHPVYRMLGGTDSVHSHMGLMEERKDFNFPPYTRIIEITFRDTDLCRIQMMSERFAGQLRTIFQDTSPSVSGSPVTGPYSPVVDRISDQHIRIIRLSLRKDRMLSGLKTATGRAIAKFEKEMRYDGHITVNVDPA